MFRYVMILSLCFGLVAPSMSAAQGKVPGEDGPQIHPRSWYMQETAVTDPATLNWLLSDAKVTSSLARAVARGDFKLTAITRWNRGQEVVYRFAFKATKASLFDQVFFDVNTGKNEQGTVVIEDVTPLVEKTPDFPNR